MTANRKEVYAAIYRVLAEGDAEIAATITEIRCPTLVMTGAADSGNSPDMTQRMASAIPGARSVILPGLRHMTLAEVAVPRSLSREILGLIDDLRRRPAPA